MKKLNGQEKRVGVRGGKRRGFTLLEVLIGVLVLSLALLGLAAVFPVVVRTQRIARDTVVGTGMLDAAEATVRNHEFFSSRAASRGLADYAIDKVRRAPANVRTKWEVSLDSAGGARRMYTDLGRLQFRTGGPTLTTQDRLNLSSGSGAPTLIWDLAICQASETTTPTPPVGGPLAGVASTMAPPLRIALFVRRIDARIRVPANSSLTQMFEAGNAVPIGSSLAQFGEPTRDGTGYFAPPMYADVTTAIQSKRNGPYDVLEFSLPNNARNAAAQAVGLPGQILVDNMGGVHRVLRYMRNNDGSPIYNRVLLEQPLLGTTAARINAAGSLIQVTFTEQVPAGVRVFTIQP